MQVVYVDTEAYCFSTTEKSQISRTLHRAHRKSKDWLPWLSNYLTVIVEPAREISYIYSHHIIMLRVDPNPTRNSSDETAKLEPTMYHECSHISRLMILPRPGNLMDLCVFEGLAIVFQRECAADDTFLGDYRGVPVEQWTHDLRVAAKDPTAKHSDWFVKHPDGRKWIGYRVGTYLIDLARKNSPHIPLADLHALTTQQILELAGV